MAATSVRYVPNPSADALIAKSVEMTVAMKLVAASIADRAKTLVPVDTGALHDSIRVEQNGAVVAVAAGDRDAFYAGLVELGTLGVGPRPYLRTAAEAFGHLSDG